MLVYSLCRNFRSCKNSAYRGNVHNVNDLSNLVSAFFLDSEQVWICCSDIVILCSFLHRNLFIKFIDCNKISVINSMIDHIYLSKWIFPTLSLFGRLSSGCKKIYYIFFLHIMTFYMLVHYNFDIHFSCNTVYMTVV